MKEAQLFLVASSLAYTTILSLVPILAVSFAIFQAFGGLEKLYAVLEPLIMSNLAANAGGDAINALRRSVGNANARAVGISGLVGLLLTSMSMLSSAEKAIHQVWGTPMSRSLFHRISAYWLFITLGPLGLSFAIGLATSAKVPVVHLLPSGFPLLIIGVVVLFAIYKWVPARNVHWQPALLAALWSTLGLVLAKTGYAIYVRRVMSYDKIYGSLGAVPIILIWIYLVWLIILTGAALSAVLQKRVDFRLLKPLKKGS